MTVKERSGSTFETRIIDLAYNGRSVGSLNGKIVFLNGGLPGEKVRARIIRDKRRYSVGRMISIVDKSEERVKARCIHHGICGGCTWQDLDYERQLHYKRKQISDCMRHIGRIKDVEVAETIGCQDRFYYRNKMEFSFNHCDDGQFHLGLHERERFDEIFDVEDCLLESEISNEIVRWFRGFVRENDIPVYDVLNHTGFLRFLAIRETKNTGQIMINVVTTDGSIPGVEKLMESITERFPQIRTVVQNINNRKSNIARGEREIILYGDGFIEEKLLGCTFRISSNSFFQTNSRQAEILYEKTFDFLKPEPDDRLLDLYCGTGTIGICASERVSRVVGVDSEPSAIQTAEDNARINSRDNTRFYAGTAEEMFRGNADVFEGLNCAIIDPPRAGLHPKALEGLINLNLPRIVHISCNPSTFARDAAHLVNSGYKINEIVPVDMFPHTMHIELVAGFYK